MKVEAAQIFFYIQILIIIFGYLKKKNKMTRIKITARMTTGGILFYI